MNGKFSATSQSIPLPTHVHNTIIGKSDLWRNTNLPSQGQLSIASISNVEAFFPFRTCFCPSTFLYLKLWLFNLRSMVSRPVRSITFLSCTNSLLDLQQTLLQQPLNTPQCLWLGSLTRHQIQNIPQNPVMDLKLLRTLQ